MSIAVPFRYQKQSKTKSGLTVLLLASLISIPLWADDNAVPTDDAGYDSNTWATFLQSLDQKPVKQQRVNAPSANQTLAYTSNNNSGAGSHARQTPKARIVRQVFRSEIDAVVHAMNQYNPLSVAEDREYIGAIYQLNNGDFIYSVAPGKIGADQIKAGIPKLKSSRFVALWHTHGAAHWTRKFFSDIDTSLVKTLKLPFYMGSADGLLRVFRPEHKTLSSLQSRRYGLGYRSGYGLGELIDKVSIAVR